MMTLNLDLRVDGRQGGDPAPARCYCWQGAAARRGAGGA